MGGYNEFGFCLNTVEELDPERQRWTFAEHFRTERDALAAAS
jgi:hypothetical protein